MKETLGKVLRIFTTVLMVLSQSVETVRLFRRYKGEQIAELQAEKDKIAEERRQSAEMLAELQALRAQLGQNAPEDGAAPVPDSAPRRPAGNVGRTPSTLDPTASDAANSGDKVLQPPSDENNSGTNNTETPSGPPTGTEGTTGTSESGDTGTTGTTGTTSDTSGGGDTTVTENGSET